METPPTKELLKKMLEFEKSHERLKQEMCSFKAVSTELGHSVSQAKRNIDQGALALRKSCANSLRKESSVSLRARVGGGAGPSAGRFTHQQYLNIVQSMGQSVHIFDLNMRIIFWNAMAEKQFGYTAEEAVGKNPINVLVDDQDVAFATKIVQGCFSGETWTGEFPLRRKSGHRFSAVTTCSPFYDDAGSLVGLIALTSNAAPYLHPSISWANNNAKKGEKNSSPVSSFVSMLGLESKEAIGLDSHHQAIQAAIASNISDLVSTIFKVVESVRLVLYSQACKLSNKVMLKMRAGPVQRAMETTPTKEILMKMLELEESQERLMQEMSKLKVSTGLRQRSHSRNIDEGALALKKSGANSVRKKNRIHDSISLRDGVGAGTGRPSVGKFTQKQYLNIVQSMGQSVHAFDLKMRIIFWNAMAEKQFGYTSEEAVGQNPINVMVDDQDAAFAMNIAQRCFNGESWTGEFPVRNKSGHRFSAVTTCSPFYDDAGSLVGIISLTSNAAPYLHPSISLAKLKAKQGETNSSSVSSFVSKLGLESKGAVLSKLGLGSHQPMQAALASKISDLACKVSNKVMSKMRVGERSGAALSEGVFAASLSDHRDNASSSASIQRGDFIYSPFGVFRCDEKHKSHQVNPCSDVNLKSGSSDSKKSSSGKGSSLWSSPNSNNRSSSSSSRSTSNSVMNKVDTDSDCLEYEILWDDLTVGEEIGKGSCGTVYRGLWFGSVVAIKVFSKEEYSKEVIQSFRQEVSLMKRLRHPNVLLFMGAVTSPQRLCIVSELLPRGSLFQLLQRKMSKLDWKRRINMALDIARGMNYLHCCSPPIVHCDLKSSNLLVDRNLTVKVADFGLSRVKHETYLTTKSGKGTPQWMAPEVLRNESADEKSDIYSFGVVLWELATEKIPWETLNSMQVIGAVGFMNQRLEIPKDIDPLWISIVESCWNSDAKLRPTFQELTEKLRDLQRKYTIQFQATREALPDNSLLKG
ncbi:Serine-threonine/tyrosine-protein kinase [Hirschfeldia incana]|nr:Serine-threonine/tyrosine-protein kinase [Hirschfeldia incana]